MQQSPKTKPQLVSENLREILLPLQQDVADLELALYDLLDSEVPFIKTAADYILKNGGKRLRPILTVVCAKMAGYSGKEASRLGACIEFVHTSSLLHDDVIDNAQVRRGQPSANARWGNHVSVLIGDFFYSRASQVLIELGHLGILKVLADCLVATTEGEILETTKSSDLGTTRHDYLTIIEKKTAHFFGTACQIGGMLGGVSAAFEHALRDYGYHMGMAFQLADDLLDYTSNENVFGKTSGIDLREGKLTLPLILALKQAQPDEAVVIKDALLRSGTIPGVFEHVCGIIKRYHGFQDTCDLAREHIGKAKKCLEPFRASLEKDVLLALADYVIIRER